MESTNDRMARFVEAIHSGDIDRAITTLDGIDDDPAVTSEDRHQWAIALWQVYEFDSAQTQMDRLERDASVSAEMLRAHAKLKFGVGRFESAAATMQAALRRALDDPADHLTQLASCLERCNRLDDAKSKLYDALAIDPSHSPAVRLLAHIDRREGRFEDAAERLMGQLKDHGGDWDWGLRYELAGVLDRLGRYDDAWNELLAAKEQLRPRTLPHLQQSLLIRRRQGELAKQVTDADLARWHRENHQSNESLGIALMGGFPRSGTTLLEQILSAHPACVGTDETGVLTTQFIASMVWNNPDVLDAIVELRSWDRAMQEDGRRAYLRFTEAVIGEPVGQRWLIEKNPLMTADLPLPLRLFPDARVIMPLRDPRDVLLSYFFTIVPVNWSSAPSTLIGEAANFYHDVMRHWILFRDRLAHPWIEVRYEDLLDDAEGQARRLCQLLDLPFDEAMLETQNRSSQKAIRTPSYDDVSRPLYRRSAGRWKNYQRQLEPVLDQMNRYAWEFGYE